MSSDAPDAAGLARALRAEGFAVRVEADGRLALLVPESDVAVSSLRARAWPLARAAGFTHVAVEITDDAGALERAIDRATVPGA